MPKTENQKALTLYLPQELYDKLIEFKNENGIRSDNKALIALLEPALLGNAPYVFNALPTSVLNHLDSKIEQKLSGMLETRLLSFEKELESLNKLCLWCFKFAFARLGKLESDCPEMVEEMPDEIIGEIKQVKGERSEVEQLEEMQSHPETDKDHLWVICKVPKLDRDRPLY